MSVQEIESIITRCAQTNVRLLELPGLRLEFGPSEQAHPEPAAQTLPVTPPSGANLPGQHESEADDEESRLQLAEERIANAVIEDPLGMEDMIADGLTDEIAPEVTDE